MSLEELKFASVNEAIQHLSDITESKILIAAKIHPNTGDYVIFYNVRNDHYYVFAYPKGTRVFAKSDIVKDERANGTGKEMIYSGDEDTNKIAKHISDMIAGFVKTKKMDMTKKDDSGRAIGLPAIYMADSVDSDSGSGSVEDLSKIDFETDRVYRGIGEKGLQVSLKQVENEIGRRKKQVKKAPKNRYDVKQPEFDPYAGKSQVSRTELEKMFNSSDEALQYLAEITGKTIVIK